MGRLWPYTPLEIAQTRTIFSLTHTAGMPACRFTHRVRAKFTKPLAHSPIRPAMA